MKHLRILFFAAVLILAQSCGKGEFISDVAFEVIEHGDYSGAKQSNQMEMDSNTEWEDFWVNELQRDINNIPEVDFDKDMVVALFLGERHTGGFQISTTKIEEYEHEIEVQYEEHVPDGIVTQAFTYPYQLITMPLTDKKIVYTKK